MAQIDLSKLTVSAGAKVLPVLSVLIILFFTTGCGSRPEGYGVVRWSPDEEAIPTGTLLEITSISNIQETYTGTAPETGEVTLPQWRVEFFAQQQAAENFRETYNEYVHYYAHNMRDRHLIREAPDLNARIVYRLRQGQLIKVLSRHPEPLTIGEHTGYWYKVLTEDGFSGYSFDMHLDVFDITQEREIPADPKLLLVKRALERTYRPIEFLDMMREERVDLEQFRPEYGIFPNPEEQYIKIANKHHTITFEYHTIDHISGSVYRFRDSELELEVVTETERTVRVYYVHEGETFSNHYVIMENINRHIQNEEERREQLLKNILETGSLFTSTAYGTLILDSNGRFTWENNRRLVPDIIPSDSGNQGKVTFTHFLGEGLRNRYDGVISFTFDGRPGMPVHFLFAVQERGLRLVHAPQRIIEDDKVIRRESEVPLVIAFTGSPPPQEDVEQE